jgi:fatty acid CoA ligase FadD9
MDKSAVLTQSSAAHLNACLLKTSLERLHQALPNDPALREAMPLADTLEELQDESLTAIEVLAKACAAYADRPALGERAWIRETTPAGPALRILPEFRTIPYRTLWQRTVDLATGLVRDPRTALKSGEVAGICGFGSIDYAIADMACLYAGVASAVLPVSMGPEDLQHIANEAAFACIICARVSLPAVLAALPRCPSVRSILVMDLRDEPLGEGQDGTAPDRPLLTLAEIAAQGHGAPALAPFIPAAGSDPLATLMYTSGSTGFPKGAMLSQRVWRSHWLLLTLEQFARFPSIGISFYPLSHAMGRNALVRTLVLGGVTHFTLESDMSTLFEDIRLVRPTFLYLVPRVAEMIHQVYRARLQRLGPGINPDEAKAGVFADMGSTFLGDRLLAAVLGSAPTAPEVVAFLTGCFGIPVFEGYGSTEAGILTVDGEISRRSVIDYKLVGVPELGYRLSDQPHPRGELRVKTRSAIAGYYHNGSATQALYDEQGFLKTGDIVSEPGPDQVVWVDRINNVVKLAQGEFVTLWRLESLFSGGSPCLDQVYLYANSQRAYVLAVVVPDWTVVRDRLRAQGPEPSASAVKQLLRQELNRVAGTAQLRPYEVPRDFLVETGRWTRENGLLTGVNKPARPQLKERYGEFLEALYRQIDQQELAAADRIDAQAPLDVKLRQAVEAVLGVADLDLASGSFSDLGGDSLSALTLATLLEERCGLVVPVAALLNPGRPLADLVRTLAAGPGPAVDAPPSFARVHGLGAASIRADDLRLEVFFRPGELEEADRVAAQPLPAEVRTVLLTGASGFLGHVLCLEWLEQMAKVGGRVICLVRAADDAAATARLKAAYATGDPALEQRFRELAADRLLVLAGDFAAPGLGLPEAVHQRLAAEVDLIVHAGALVNHVFSYEQLFASNVAGTAQLMRLAVHLRRKRFDYVSTIGVLEGARKPGKVPERLGVDALQPVWPAAGGYAHGYATSKWASEVLLRELHRQFATPVRVFRCDMILPHRRYRGQANAPDLLTRLIASVIYTGLAPRSFYPEGQGAKAHYDGLPVDFIAAAMVALSSAGQEGLATYQVSNAHWDDGVSLDTLIDWIQSAGYPLERVTDYAAWYAAFSARLQALPAGERQHSSLPILQQWAKPRPYRETERIDASQFGRQVRRRRPAGEAEIPHLSEAYLHKYLADLRALEIL